MSTGRAEPIETTLQWRIQTPKPVPENATLPAGKHRCKKKNTSLLHIPSCEFAVEKKKRGEARSWGSSNVGKSQESQLEVFGKSAVPEAIATSIIKPSASGVGNRQLDDRSLRHGSNAKSNHPISDAYSAT
jgi:hypothetical protein